MNRDHRDIERFAIFRNIVELGLSTIIAVVLPLIILGYVISIGLLIVPFGFGLPLGIGCGIIHTITIITGLLVLAIPRLILKIRESRLRKEIDSLPEDEKKRRETVEIALLLLAMGYTPIDEEGSVMMMESEVTVNRINGEAEITYRDFSRPMGWAYYKGEAEIITTDRRHIIIPSEAGRNAISYFTRIMAGENPIFIMNIRSGSDRSRIVYINRSGRRIMNKVTPTVRLRVIPDQATGDIDIDSFLEILGQRPDILEEGRKQRELLSVWIR
jgi:hypothetical protein